ncbi:MAG: serine protein kinase [Planctomycetota bacterium]
MREHRKTDPAVGSRGDRPASGETSLAQLAKEAARTEAESAAPWEGSLDDYLRLVEEHPEHARNAWQRLADMIESHGRTARKSAGLPPRWHVFDDPFGARPTTSSADGDDERPMGPDAVFGLDQSLHDLVMTVRAGARRLGPERRILLLHGPVGSAKSTIARILKRGLEHYTRTDTGAIFTFDWVIDGEVIPSPMNQDPLLLLPRSARGDVEAKLNAAWGRDDRLLIEGELDPVSQFWLDHLMERYEGDWSRAVEHVRVRRFTFSEAGRVGIGTFQPKDEKNQDSTELTGDLNYRKIAEYGSDSDPRAFNFDGEFNVANRGMLEFIEVLKLDVAFLYDLLGATQEHAIKPKKFQSTHIDEVILGHTNEPEYRKLQSNELMEAFRDRTIRIDVPYNLGLSDEAEIHRRRFGRRGAPGRRLAPHCLEVASMWAVLTRLEDPKHPSLSLVQKARLYDGEDVPGFTGEQARELREAAEREGLDGISPRYVQDRIATCLVEERASIGPRDVLDAIERGLGAHSMVASDELRKRYLGLVAVAREEYDTIIREEVESAIAADQDALDRLCSKYLDNVRAYTTREQVAGEDGVLRAPDERLMRAVEEKTDIPEARKDDFRHELMNYIAAVHLEGGQFDFRENRRLRRALELKLFEDQRDSIQLTSLVSSVVDPDTQEKIAVIRDRLIRQFGYDERSADTVLRDVAGLFVRAEEEARDKAAGGDGDGDEAAA